MFAALAKAQTKAMSNSLDKRARQGPTCVPRSIDAGVGKARRIGQGIGNQDTLRTLAQEATSFMGDVTREIQTQRPTRFAATRLADTLQAKLVVGQQQDPLEHEANHVAETVMRTADPDVSVTAAPLRVSHKCDACKVEEAATHLQCKQAMPVTDATGGVPSIVHEVLRSPGRPLDAMARSFFEPRFGRDFSHIRVHTDGLASRSAELMAARAYTVGHNIGFRRGEYAPGTDAGRHLLAHELAHSVQQGSAGLLGSTPVRSRLNDTLVQRQPEELAQAPAPAPSVFPPSPPPPHVGPDIYICWSPTELAPSANHSWFRVGGPEPQGDHETFSLFPRLVRQAGDGSRCSQGMTFRGADDADISRAGSCMKTPLNYGCIESNFARYPMGTYCPLGPNSNTFTGSIARACNLPSNLVVPDWVPGFEDQPPKAGTFGPDWNTMTATGLFTCGPKDCGEPATSGIPEVNVEDLPQAPPDSEPIPEVNVEDLPSAN